MYHSYNNKKNPQKQKTESLKTTENNWYWCKALCVAKSLLQIEEYQVEWEGEKREEE